MPIGLQLPWSSLSGLVLHAAEDFKLRVERGLADHASLADVLLHHLEPIVQLPLWLV